MVTCKECGESLTPVCFACYEDSDPGRPAGLASTVTLSEDDRERLRSMAEQIEENIAVKAFTNAILTPSDGWQKQRNDWKADADLLRRLLGE